MPGRKRCVGFQPHFLYFEPRRCDVSYRCVGKHIESRGTGKYSAERLSSVESGGSWGKNWRFATYFPSLSEARRKIAEAFIEGKAIRVEGGDYVLIGAKDEAPGVKSATWLDERAESRSSSLIRTLFTIWRERIRMNAMSDHCYQAASITYI